MIEIIKTISKFPGQSKKIISRRNSFKKITITVKPFRAIKVFHRYIYFIQLFRIKNPDNGSVLDQKRFIETVWMRFLFKVLHNNYKIISSVPKSAGFR